MKTENELWDFAIQYYSYPQVAEQLLTLQDQQEFSVNLQIYAIWLASIDRKLIKLPQPMSEVNKWQQKISSPLRQIRMQVKQKKIDNPLLEPSLAECYQQLLKAELAVEKIELGLLHQQYLSNSELDEKTNNWHKLINTNLDLYWGKNSNDPCVKKSEDLGDIKNQLKVTTREFLSNQLIL